MLISIIIGEIDGRLFIHNNQPLNPKSLLRSSLIVTCLILADLQRICPFSFVVDPFSFHYYYWPLYTIIFLVLVVVIALKHTQYILHTVLASDSFCIIISLASLLPVSITYLHHHHRIIPFFFLSTNLFFYLLQYVFISDNIM